MQFYLTGLSTEQQHVARGGRKRKRLCDTVHPEAMVNRPSSPSHSSRMKNDGPRVGRVFVIAAFEKGCSSSPPKILWKFIETERRHKGVAVIFLPNLLRFDALHALQHVQITPFFLIAVILLYDETRRSIPIIVALQQPTVKCVSRSSWNYHGN